MKPEQTFEPGSEQFLAAVLYVARDAERAWQKHQRSTTRLSRWWYLNRVVRRLDISEQVSMNYAQMRGELIRFAETFGVEGASRNVPSAAASRDAASAFDDIEE